jgi:hypothetical protein
MLLLSMLKHPKGQVVGQNIKEMKQNKNRNHP